MKRRFELLNTVLGRGVQTGRDERGGVQQREVLRLSPPLPLQGAPGPPQLPAEDQPRRPRRLLLLQRRLEAHSQE